MNDPFEAFESDSWLPTGVAPDKADDAPKSSRVDTKRMDNSKRIWFSMWG